VNKQCIFLTSFIGVLGRRY